MRVTGAHDIGSRLQQRSVDVVSRRIHRAGRFAVFVYDIATGADQDQPIRRRRAERHTPVEEPKMIGEDRIACRDVAVTELPPSLGTKDPVSQRTHLFAVGPFVLR